MAFLNSDQLSTYGHLFDPNPDYSSLLANDPTYQQTMAWVNAQNAAALANYNYLRQNALGQYTGENGIFDRLKQALQVTQLGINSNLGARGLDHSGEMGYQQGQAKTRYSEQNDDAKRALSDYLYGISQTYAEQQRQNSLGLINAGQSAYDRQLGLWEATHPNGLPTAPAGYPTPPQPTEMGYSPNPQAQYPNFGPPSAYRPPAAPTVRSAFAPVAAHRASGPLSAFGPTGPGF